MLGLSAYYGFFIGRWWADWLIGLVGAAYGLWVLALIVRRNKPSFCRILGLPESRYEFALADSAVVLALLAVAARIVWSLDTGLPITAHPGLPLALAGLAFLMRTVSKSDIGPCGVRIADVVIGRQYRVNLRVGNRPRSRDGAPCTLLGSPR